MFGRLYIAERGRPERIVDLTGTATIGRTNDNDIVLHSDGVSHCHAMLLVQPHGVALLDMGSTFGTFVDTIQAPPDEPIRLIDGARISIGRAALRYLAPRTTTALPALINGQLPERAPLATAHLNTRFDGLTPDEPLKVGQRVPLLIWVGAPLLPDECQSSRPLQLVSQGLTAPVELRVRVRAATSAWRAVAEEPILLAAAWGSAQVARYRIVARRPERAKLGVSVDLAETHSLLQHFKLGVYAVQRKGACAVSLPARAATDAFRMRCRRCGASVRVGARYCTQCGEML